MQPWRPPNLRLGAFCLSFSALPAHSGFEMGSMAEHWLTVLIVALTYAGIAAGRWPGLKVNRATMALLGVGFLVLFGRVAFDGLSKLIDFDTIVLLFSMMVINANLRIAGFFSLVGDAVLRLTRTPRALLAVEVLAVGLLSALFLNDTICLMFTPLVVEMTRRANRQPVPYLIALATAANVGSTATLTGNPQNMIIGVASGIPYVRFAGALVPVALAGLGVIWGILVMLYPREFARERLPILAPSAVTTVRPLLIKASLVTAGLMVAFLAGVPVALAAFLAACALLLTRRVHPQEVFAEFDWGLLVFFCGLFIVSGALEVNGITAQLFQFLHLDGGSSAWAFSFLTAGLSNIVSNVPAVLLLKPVVGAMSYPVAGWLMLAASSTLAGNLTLLGSVANLIVAECAAGRGVRLGFWEYTRAGASITVITLLISTAWLELTVWP